MKYYMLIDGLIKEANSINEWLKWNRTSNRRVALNEIDDITISTVFLGIDHNYNTNGLPILFETMIFGGSHDEECFRCSTLEEAKEYHKRAIQLVEESKSMAEKMKKFKEKG